MAERKNNNKTPNQVTGSALPSNNAKNNRKSHKYRNLNSRTREIDRRFWWFEELVENSSSRRNWKGILIALLVIFVVCSFILLAIVLVTPRDIFTKYNVKHLKPGEAFSFEDVFSQDFKPRVFAHQWATEEDILMFSSRDGDILAYHLRRNETTVVMPNGTYKQIASDKFTVSADLNFILLVFDVKHIYRQSYTAKYKIYIRNRPSDENMFVDFPYSASDPSEWQTRELQYVEWAPRGHSLMFVYDYNLYYQQDPTSQPVKISSNGRHNYIYNAIPDWLYEEEILKSNSALWWGPDGQQLLYAEFNDTDVPLYKFAEYGDYDNIYGDIEEMRYPKAGDYSSNINPTVKLYLVDINNPADKKVISPPEAFVNSEHYLFNVKWLNSSFILVTWANRVQNHSIVSLCDVRTAQCLTNYEVLVPNGWVRMVEPWSVPDDDGFYLTILSRRDHSRFWRHVARATTPTQGPCVSVFVTQGAWDVTEIVGTDREYVYFLGTGGDPTKRHLFRAHARLHDQVPECLSCAMGAQCLYVDASFSRSGTFYVLSCLGPDVPSYILKSTVDSRNITVEGNIELRNRLNKKKRPRKVFMEIESVEGYDIGISLLLPPILNTTHITEYPLLVKTYGGPDTQQVTQRFSLDWSTYLSSAQNVIVASIDGRGSLARGENHLFQIYRNLGTVEVQDQLTAIKYLTKTLRYVDKERNAIWGQSYGGFVSSHAVGDDTNTVRCGVAASPVTDFRYYDTAYTERYMRLASTADNYKSYDRSNVSVKAESFLGKKFLLVHGTADDNVHFQNSAQLIKALTQAGVNFRTQIYTDKAHSLSGQKTWRHLYKTIENFLKTECWDGGVPRDRITKEVPKTKNS